MGDRERDGGERKKNHTHPYKSLWVINECIMYERMIRWARSSWRTLNWLRTTAVCCHDRRPVPTKKYSGKGGGGAAAPRFEPPQKVVDVDHSDSATRGASDMVRGLRCVDLLSSVMSEINLFSVRWVLLHRTVRTLQPAERKRSTGVGPSPPHKRKEILHTV